MSTLELLASTLQHIRPRITNLLEVSMPFMRMMGDAGAIEEGASGLFITEPDLVNTHSQGTPLITGDERLNLDYQQPMNGAQYYPAFAAWPVMMNEVIATINSGEEAQVSILEGRYTAAMNLAMRSTEGQLTAGNDAVWAQTPLNTLYGHATLTANGFLEGRTPTNQVNSVGGISKTINATGLVPGWANQFADCGGTFSLNAMNQIAIQTRLKGLFGPADIILATAEHYNAYKQLLYANERWVHNGKGKENIDAGDFQLMFEGGKMEPSGFMPTGNATANFNPSMFFINSKSIGIHFWKNKNFETGKMQELIEQAGTLCKIFVGLQMTCRHIGNNGFIGDGG